MREDATYGERDAIYGEVTYRDAVYGEVTYRDTIYGEVV